MSVALHENRLSVTDVDHVNKELGKKKKVLEMYVSLLRGVMVMWDV